MARLWVAFLAVTSIVCVKDVAGSVLHGVVNAPSAYPQLIPYHLAYSHIQSPIVLSKIHEVSVGADHGTGSNTQDGSPAPVVEISVDDASSNNLITEHELIQQIFKSQHKLDSGIVIGEAATSSIVEESGRTSADKEQLPPTRPEGSVAIKEVDKSEVLPPVAPSPAVINAERKILEGDTKTSEVQINTEKGNLQMQATLVAGGEGVRVSVGDQAKPIVETISSELPSIRVPQDAKPKGVANVNVNVNVNVNGDGTGSVINSTSVAEITAPIKAHHKKCD